MIICGIDPGKHGALFLLTPEGRCYTDIAGTVPVIKKTKKVKEKIDYPMLHAAWSGALTYADEIFLERVSAMPGQGVTSMFNFGYIAGFMYSMALSSGKKVTFVRPQEWKKEMDLIGAEKEESPRMASKLLPKCAILWPLKKHEGIAEAALIALYGQRLRLKEKA